MDDGIRRYGMVAVAHHGILLLSATWALHRYLNASVSSRLRWTMRNSTRDGVHREKASQREDIQEA